MFSPRAILFDMDGTLTAPLLDFPRIRADLGVPGDAGILEHLATLDPARRAAAEAVLHEHEESAAAASSLNPGCRELLAWLADRRLPTAVITRNSRACAEIVFARHGLRFDAVITREDGPFKPDPAPLHAACQALQTASTQSWMVGDGAYDVQAGHAAGCATVWLSHGSARRFEPAPWHVASDLPDFHNLLRRWVS